MSIKNKLLTFSSLCLVGAVTFSVVKYSPASKGAKSGDTEILNDTQQSKNFDFGDENDSMVILSDILTDIDAQNLLNEDVNNQKDKDFKDSLPDLPGVGKMSFDRKDFANFAIVTGVDNELIIREKPDEDSKVVGRLVKNGGCFVVGTHGDWCEIKSGRVQGFVQSKYLIRGEKAIEYIQKEGWYYAIAKDELKVRKGPSTSEEELYRIAKGEALRVVKVEGDWVKVQSEIGDKDEDAYVSRDYVTIQYQLKQAEKEDDSGYMSVGMSSQRTRIMEKAKATIGVPYVWGGTNLASGVDCSGFVQQVYLKIAGISLPRTAAQQSTCGKSVSEADLKPGDLIFYRSGGRVTHVGFYAGNGNLLHAPQPGDRVKYSNMNYSSNRFYRRILDD